MYCRVCESGCPPVCCSNFYFLCVAILQTVPEVSITNGVPATFLPLSIVLGFDGIVTAREDYKRHQDDARANSSESECSTAAEGAADWQLQLARRRLLCEPATSTFAT